MAKGDWEAIPVTIEGPATPPQQTEEDFYKVVLEMKEHFEKNSSPESRASHPKLVDLSDSEYKSLIQRTYLQYGVQFLVAWNLLGHEVGERIIPLFSTLFVDNLEPHRRMNPTWLNTYVLCESEEVKRFPPLQMFNAIYHYPKPCTEETWEKIFKHPDTCYLRGIYLQDSWFGDPLVKSIVHATQFNKKLVKLDIQSNKITSEGAKILAKCENLKNLTHLCVFRNWIEEEGVHALFAAGENFPSLKMMSIGYQSGVNKKVYIEGLEKSMDSVFPALEDLVIQCTVYDEEGWEPFVETTFSKLKSGGKFPNLKNILLQGHDGGDDKRETKDGVAIYL